MLVVPRCPGSLGREEEEEGEEEGEEEEGREGVAVVRY